MEQTPHFYPRTGKDGLIAAVHISATTPTATVIVSQHGRQIRPTLLPETLDSDVHGISVPKMISTTRC